MASDLLGREDFDVRLTAVVHGLGIIAAAFAGGLLLASLVVSLVGLAGVTLDTESTPFYLLSAVCQFTGFILVVVAYVYYREDFTLFELRVPSLRQGLVILGGFVLLYLVNMGAGAVALVFDLETATNVVVDRGQANPELFLYMIPITVLLVAPGEELVFRGVVQGWFRRGFGVVPGVLIASVLFGVVHAGALLGDGALLYITVATMLGIVLGTLYEYTENLVVPIAVHALYNIVLFGLQYLVASGYVQVPS